ncbi:DUF2955 domain-containing protein [Pseudomonas alkylphenolica]|nr:DUF2955 domain-containing protein [Pseudomonas alkylphenolica]
MAGGGTTGFYLCKLFNWDYGAFFVLYPVLLLGLVPILNPSIIRQFLAQGVVCAVEVALLQGMFGDRPVLMIPIVFLLFLYRFALMARGPLMLFGALATVFLSMQLHFASYPDINVVEMLFSNAVAIWLAILIACVMYVLFPDREPRQPPPASTKDTASLRHEALLGASAATFSFVIFQCFNLFDTLAAQIAGILVLFPMHWKGVHFAGRERALGTIIGCLVAMIIQLIVYTHYDVLPIVGLLLWVGFMLCARWHMMDMGRPGAGFATVTTLAVIFGQDLTMNQDIMQNTAYRLASTCVSVLGMLVVVFLLHRFFNLFEPTRHAKH